MRYFRDLGIDADLFLIPGATKIHSHFDPSEDTWTDLTNVNWIKEFPVSYHWSNYINWSYKTVRKTFKCYDKVIACGPAVGLLHRAGITVDMFIPYGGDLFNLPFPSDRNHDENWLKFLLILHRSTLQKQGIQNAKFIISNANWKVANDAVEKLGCSALNLPRIMIYKENNPKNKCSNFDFFDDHDFVVFSPTRHLWKSNAEPMQDYKKFGGAKRNDKLIRAFSRVINNIRNIKPLLVFCEFGADVNESKQLINELGISQYVCWMPLMSRKELVIGISKATFVADQFREGMSATSAGTTNEALAYGTPVITNTDGAIYKENDPYFGCPILQALSEEEIFQHFEKYFDNTECYRKIGIDSKKWFVDNLGVGLAGKYLKILSDENHLI